MLARAGHSGPGLQMRPMCDRRLPGSGGRFELRQSSLTRVVPALRAGRDAIAGLRRPIDVLALVPDAPLERERRAERDAALRGAVLAALALVVGKRLLEADEPLPVAFDLVVEEGDRLARIEEPEHEEAQDRLVANRSIRLGLAQPPLDLVDPARGDGIGLAPAWPGLRHPQETVPLELGERGVDLRVTRRPGSRERALEEAGEPIAAHRLGRDQPQQRAAQDRGTHAQPTVSVLSDMSTLTYRPPPGTVGSRKTTRRSHARRGGTRGGDALRPLHHVGGVV